MLKAKIKMSKIRNKYMNVTTIKTETQSSLLKELLVLLLEMLTLQGI